MITDARVLRDEFVPNDVVHRDDEMNALTRALQPIVEGNTARTAFLFGPSGAGKTCLARFALDRLQERVIYLNRRYLDCWETPTRFGALYELLDGVKGVGPIQRNGTATGDLLERLRNYAGPQFVVVLDEADQLEDEGVIHDLYRTPKISMILIANREEELFAQLDDRLVSRLHVSERIRFDAYYDHELAAILRDRVQWGFEPGVIDESHIERIAAESGGDARTAITILRDAADEAQRLGLDAFTDGLLDRMIPEAKQSVQRKHIGQLTDHQRALYEILYDAGELTASEVHDSYRERVEEPRTQRTVRNYLTKLEDYNLIASDGETRARQYRCVV